MKMNKNGSNLKKMSRGNQKKIAILTAAGVQFQVKVTFQTLKADATLTDHKDGVVEQPIVPQEDVPLGASKRMFSQSSGTLSEEEEMIQDLDEPFRVRRSIDTTDGPRKPVSEHCKSTTDNQELRHIENLQAIPLPLQSEHQQKANTISIQIEEEIEDEDHKGETERLLQERKTIKYTNDIDQVNKGDSELPKDDVAIEISDNNNVSPFSKKVCEETGVIIHGTFIEDNRHASESDCLIHSPC